MLKNTVIEFFGGAKKVADALGISASAVSQWGEVIPEISAYRIQDITKGKLKADSFTYRSK